MTKQSDPVRTKDLVLRCYARRTGSARSRWVAHCIDIDVWGTGNSCEEAKKSIEDAIGVYMETVVDTEDRASIAELIRRPAPFGYFALWYAMRLISAIMSPWDGNTPLDSHPFVEPVPFRLASV